jgi:hypothetical protein
VVSAAGRARSDLALAVALALAGVLAAAALPESLGFVRVLIAGPLVLVLPGYALTRATLAPEDLRGPELGAMSVALSVAVTIFSALIIDALGAKLTLWPWIAILAAVTIAAAAVAGRRGHARPLRGPALAPRVGELVVLAAALVLIAGAAVLGFSPLAAPKGTDGTVALHILPTHPVRLSVTSDETRLTSYTVAVTVSGRAPRRFGPFTLAPGASWSGLVAVGPGKPAVVARLSVAGAAAPARTVSLRCWCTSVRSAATP